MSDNVQDKLKKLSEQLEEGVREVFTSGRYDEYLRTMVRFHSYSFRNTVLIWSQKPDASLVAGFSTWKNMFRRHVNKGEKGIRLFALAPFKKCVEIDKLYPITQGPVLGSDGSVIKEEVEITIPAFRPVSVFDVSKRKGESFPRWPMILWRMLSDTMT